MTTITRVNANKARPEYKEYVNFLDSYRNGSGGTLNRKDQDQTSIDSGYSMKSLSLSNSSNSTSNSSLNSDQTDFSKNSSCTPFNNYLENYKNKKFNPVKLATNNINNNLNKDDNNSNVKTMKSEIFIEITPNNNQHINNETKRIIEKPKKLINEKICIFEKSKLIPPSSSSSSSSSSSIKTNFPIENQISNVKLDDSPLSLVPVTVVDNKEDSEEYEDLPPPPPPPPPSLDNLDSNYDIPLPPPPPPIIPSTVPVIKETVPQQSILIKKPQVNYSSTMVNNELNKIDRNNPMVKKLVYGTLRGMYGAYHDKANDFVATLPRNMVRKDNNIQNIINTIASNGDLEKLNGRVNPKVDQE